MAGVPLPLPGEGQLDSGSYDDERVALLSESGKEVTIVSGGRQRNLSGGNDNVFDPNAAIKQKCKPKSY